MFCKSCGEKLMDGVKFCTKCGTAVGEDVSPVAADTGQNVASQSTVMPSMEPPKKYIVPVLVMSIIALPLYLFSFYAFTQAILDEHIMRNGLTTFGFALAHAILCIAQGAKRSIKLLKIMGIIGAVLYPLSFLLILGAFDGGEDGYYFGAIFAGLGYAFVFAVIALANARSRMETKTNAVVASIASLVVIIGGVAFFGGQKSETIGPAGGIVFYDKGYYSDGWRYLEAAPADAEFIAQWGAFSKKEDVFEVPNFFEVSGTNTGVGSGKQNTQVIVDFLNRRGEAFRAAQICASMDINGYKDWFLPSRDELDLMHKNLKRKRLGGFGGGTYWSSSQNDSYCAWCHDFGNGHQYTFIAKSAEYSVRAVRAF